MKNLVPSQIPTLSFALLALSMTACGNNSQFLKGMNLSVSEQNGSSYVNLAADIDLGNVALDNLAFPIYDPHTGGEIGKVGLGLSPAGKEQIILSVNAGSMMNGDAQLGSVLPNGRPIPGLLGATPGQVFAIPALNYSRIYIGGDLKSSIVVGVALAVQALDNVTGTIGLNSNIFFSQIFNPSLSGLAGIYASGTAHQNGIAIFGKYTAPLAPVQAPVLADAVPVNPSSDPVQVITRPSGSNFEVQSKSLTQMSQMSRDQEVQSSPVAISVSGQTPTVFGNTVVNDGMSTKSEERLYKYFYGKKRSVRPH